MSVEPFVIERVYDAHIDTVWQAITDNKKMKEWYFDISEFKAEVGFEFQFYGGDPNSDKQFLHLCRVTEVVPGKKLAYTWRYDGYTGDSLVIFELFAEGDKTRLRLTHEGLETFPANEPSFVRSNFVMGWTEIIGTILKRAVEKK